jgi:LEA14-like dessication related protein
MAAVAAVALGATACGALYRQAFKEPVITLQNVRLAGLGVTGGNLDVVLNVYNPNGYRLDATRLNYRVSVEDTQLASGVLDSRFTVQNEDSTTVRIPVSFTFSGLGAAGRAIFNTGSVNYRVTGDVAVGTPVGSFTIPFSQTGRYSTFGGGQAP